MNGSDKLTETSIKELLESVQADREAKQVFLAMPRNEQLLAILGMIAFNTQQIARLQKENIDYRHERERREQQLTELLDTTPDLKDLTPDEKQNTVQKIITLATRPARGTLVDKVMSLILLILFYLAITGKLP